MPKKFGPEVWHEVRKAVSLRLTAGETLSDACQHVSEEFGGAPAAGTIMNKFNEGWRSVSPSRRKGNEDSQNGQTYEIIRDMSNRLERLENMIANMAAPVMAPNSTDILARARAEGAAEALKDVMTVGPTWPATS